MRVTAEGKNRSKGWGMGFLLVLFPEDEPIDVNKKNNDLFSSSPSPCPSPSLSSSPSPLSTTSTTKATFRRSTSNHLLSKAQSTISICALLIFFTLLLFTLSTFEPTVTTARHFTSRRHLNSPILYKKSTGISSFSSWLKNILTHEPEIDVHSRALQGMGTLYRRGTKAMNDLIVVHVVESVTAQELRLFLRLIHRSGLTLRSDLVFIFPTCSDNFDPVIREENESFSKLILNSTMKSDATRFVKSGGNEKEWVEPIWGRKRIGSNYSEEGEAEPTRVNYGSVVSFLVDELDPERSLAGFLDQVPMSFRRWACYPMLLGRVRKNFKHIMLVDAREMLVVGDSLGRVRTRSAESVLVWPDSSIIRGKHGKKSSGKTRSDSRKPATPAIIVGGARGIRRLSSAMLVEIVRATAEHKKKSPVAESGLFNQLIDNEHLLKNVNVVVSAESITDSSSLTGLRSNRGPSLSLSNYTVVRRGNGNVNTTLELICLLEVDHSVYSDC
ncbi:hypothetical protein NMG60_11001056 [Bertholletia excelsa]